MDTSSLVIAALLALIVVCACSAGCSVTSSPAGTTGPAGVTTTTSPSSALYGAGDIIKNPKSTGAAVLIISYDPGTDAYERAYIYPNSDGSWGHRIDSSTLKISRSIIEQVYTEKISTVAVSAVPVGTPTAVRTPVASSTIQTLSPTVTATTTATTTVLPPPHVTGITPLTGHAGTTVSITELDGRNFRSGANVSLVKSGQSSIPATAVSVTSPVLITCTFVIPPGTATGFWDILVTNPDGQYHQYQNGFDILEGTVTTSTTTTSSAASASVTITQIQDTLLGTGCAESDKTVSILGTNLTVPIYMKLTGTSTITARAYSATSSSLATGYFTIPAGSCGTYYVTLVDSSGTVLATSSNTLTIQ